jgi:hypothetical protein
MGFRRALAFLNLIVFASLMPFTLAACAHTELPEQVVTAPPVGKAKLRLSVAVLSDSSLTIHEPMGFYEKVNPALANTIHDALAAHFEDVRTVEDKASASEADLLAIPAIDASFFGKAPVKLEVTFIEQKTGQNLAELSSAKPLDAHAPGTRDHMGTDLAITIPALIIFPPLIAIEEPYIQRHDAERFNAGFGPALVAMATDIADQASRAQTISSLSVGVATPFKD